MDDFGPMFNRGAALNLWPCDRSIADGAAKRWHYSRSIPAGIAVSYGVREYDVFKGAIVWSNGSVNGAMAYGLRDDESLTLARVALDKHVAPVTRIIAVCVRLIRRDFPSVRLLLSYADPDQGHNGAIYQGGNWIYCGMSDPGGAGMYFDGQGNKIHSRTVNDNIGSRSIENAEAHGLTFKRHSRKHKYLYPLDEAMRQQIEPLRQAAPKRAASIVADAPRIQRGEDGSKPIAALQLPKVVTFDDLPLFARLK